MEAMRLVWRWRAHAAKGASIGPGLKRIGLDLRVASQTAYSQASDPIYRHDKMPKYVIGKPYVDVSWSTKQSRPRPPDHLGELVCVLPGRHLSARPPSLNQERHRRQPAPS